MSPKVDILEGMNMDNTLNTPGITSEVGTLQTVMLHRPGRELERLTPRNHDELLFDGVPWLSRAQEEHDAFADTLTSRGVEVLYVKELLVEALASADARAEAIESATTRPHLGAVLSSVLEKYLGSLTPQELASVWIEGIRHDELRTNLGARVPGAVAAFADPSDFVMKPLPNLLFARDSSCWVGSRPVVTSLARPARLRETTLTSIIYRYHSRFEGIEPFYGPELENIEGGDMLIMGDGVVAVGAGERTSLAGVERFAQKAFEAGVAHTVLGVKLPESRAMMHLDTVCTMLDHETLVVYPLVENSLMATTITPAGSEPGALAVSELRPFYDAAADALKLDKIKVVDLGLDPVTAEREQWDDGNNTLALAPGSVFTYERNRHTNERLEQSGFEVIAIAGSELGSGRGGPRCMSCPISRAPLPTKA